MGIILDNNVKEETLYEAYGVTVKGKWNRYESKWSPDVKRALIEITLGEHKRYLGNLCVFETVFDRAIDNICYWMANEKPDAIDIDNIIDTALCKSNSLFNVHIENQKRKEKRKAEQEAARLESERKAKELHDSIVEKANKKKLFPLFHRDNCYLLKIMKDGVEEYLNKADMNMLDNIIDNIDKFAEIELKEVIEL